MGGVAKLILTLSVLASLLLSGGLLTRFSRRDSSGTVIFVSDPASGSPFLWIVFDPGADTEHIPLGRNRGYWIEPIPPEGLCSAVSRGDRLVFRMYRLGLHPFGSDIGLWEYRLQRGPQTISFSEGSAWHFWGTFGAIAAAPLLLGSIVATIVAVFSGTRIEREGR